MMQISKVVRGMELEALYSWFCEAKPVCFKCKQPLRWDQRRFWEDQKGGHVYFFCDCKFNNPLSYIQFKWEALQEFKNVDIRTWYENLVF